MKRVRGSLSTITLIDLYLWFDGEELSGHIWEDEARPNY